MAERKVGWKDDKEKRRWSLLLGKALLPAVQVVVDVLMFGAKKYGDDNWVDVENAPDRYYDALLRHLTDYRAGKRDDDDSKLPTLGHVVACALFLLAFDLAERKVP